MLQSKLAHHPWFQGNSVNSFLLCDIYDLEKDLIGFFSSTSTYDFLMDFASATV